MKICIVVSDYYKDISENLLEGCISELKKRGYKNLNIKFVSGAFEIPNLISKNHICSIELHGNRDFQVNSTKILHLLRKLSYV